MKKPTKKCLSRIVQITARLDKLSTKLYKVERSRKKTKDVETSQILDTMGDLYGELYVLTGKKHKGTLNKSTVLKERAGVV